MSNPLERVRAAFRRGIGGLVFFTFVTNILLLVQPIYMLQVYDRVLVSGSVETLVFISLMALAALVLLGVIDGIRSMLAARMAAAIDVAAGGDALVAAMNEPRAALGDVQPLRDLSMVRNFISAKTIFTLIELPFAPVFIGLLYLVHPHLFWLTVIGAGVQILLTFANQAATLRQSARAGEHAMSAMLAAQSFVRGAESITAMGMRGSVVQAWGASEARSLDAQEQNARVSAIFASLSRVVRLVLQIAILGYGGYLVINQEMTAGMIFASSLISGRGLQPIDQLVGNWRSFVEAAAAWRRLKSALARLPDQRRLVDLPAPTGRIKADDLTVLPRAQVQSGVPEAILKRVSFEIGAGECVAVIGPSGAGKSTLARAIVGALQPRSGAVLIDGADIRTWNPEKLGRWFGYLAQEVDLLPGTVAQNIARFRPDAVDADIVVAAQKAQVHELIIDLPDGYNTVIGPSGRQLAGGERQRIGLARAFFGSPKILVLDEPNSSLDTEGEIALDRALAVARTDAVTVLIVTQRRPVAERADRILVMRDGGVADFGPPAEVMARMRSTKPAAAAPAGRPVLVPTQEAVRGGPGMKLAVIGGRTDAAQDGEGGPETAPKGTGSDAG